MIDKFLLTGNGVVWSLIPTEVDGEVVPSMDAHICDFIGVTESGTVVYRDVENGKVHTGWQLDVEWKDIEGLELLFDKIPESVKINCQVCDDDPVRLLQSRPPRCPACGLRGALQ